MVAVSQYLQSTLALHYGSAKHRFSVDSQLISKWLHHVGEVTSESMARHGLTVSVTYH